MQQPTQTDPPLADAEAPLDHHPSRGKEEAEAWQHGEESALCFMAFDSDYAKAPKFINLSEVTLIVTEGTKNLCAANTQRVATLNTAPVKKVEFAPQKYQAADEPPLLHNPAGYSTEGRPKEYLTYTPQTDNRIEPNSCIKSRAVVESKQGIQADKDLAVFYTYVALDCGNLLIPCFTKGGFVKTRYRHHVTIAYLAATSNRWKQTVKEHWNRSFDNWIKNTNTGYMDTANHWMDRPSWCCHFRHANMHKGDNASQARALISTPWPAALQMARDGVLTTKPWNTAAGGAMTNEQTVYHIKKAGHEKFYDYEIIERNTIHSIINPVAPPGQHQYIVSLTDANHNLQLPSEIITLAAYSSDVVITNGANGMHPRTYNFVLPQHRLHMTPQTIGGPGAIGRDPNHSGEIPTTRERSQPTVGDQIPTKHQNNNFGRDPNRSYLLNKINKILKLGTSY